MVQALSTVEKRLSKKRISLCLFKRHEEVVNLKTVRMKASI